ncbi:MAG: hypothetical protein ACI8PZ_001870 [Myxococcota bacterium]|jgi:hypothetical protein
MSFLLLLTVALAQDLAPMADPSTAVGQPGDPVVEVTYEADDANSPLEFVALPPSPAAAEGLVAKARAEPVPLEDQAERTRVSLCALMLELSAGPVPGC